MGFVVLTSVIVSRSWTSEALAIKETHLRPSYLRFVGSAVSIVFASTMMRRATIVCLVWLLVPATAWLPSPITTHRPPTRLSSTTTSTIDSNLQLLRKAAETKDQDPTAVGQALVDLERQMRQASKEDASVAEQTLDNLNGAWRLVFTTGTKKTQDQIGAINYFPLKAVQTFDTTNGAITNGIFLGDWAAIRFAGDFDFDLKKRRLEFDFNSIQVLGFTIPLKSGEAADLGAKSGLGSKSNVENAEKGKRPFFNWISADEYIATARGGGGGLALWKRVEEEGK